MNARADERSVQQLFVWQDNRACIGVRRGAIDGGHGVMLMEVKCCVGILQANTLLSPWLNKFK